MEAVAHVSALDPVAVLAWYDRQARRLPWRVGPAERARGVAPDPYRVWLSEVMLQQTTIAAAGRYFRRFVEIWPTVEDLARAPLDAVLVEWAGLGYYARARNMHACAAHVAGSLGGKFPATANGLRELPGVGAYTAAAIAAICFDERVAVLDGNVERVLARFAALDRSVAEVKHDMRSALGAVVPERAGDFAQAMMDLGATICAPRTASCLACPLQPACLGARSGNPAQFPRPVEKVPRPTRFGHAFVVRRGDGAVWLRQRPPKGLLARMTETPGTAWSAARVPAQFPVAGAWRSAGRVVHVFTHFRLELEVWQAAVDGDHDLGPGWWAAAGRLDAEALPSLFRKVLAAAGIQN